MNLFYPDYESNVLYYVKKSSFASTVPMQESKMRILSIQKNVARSDRVQCIHVMYKW